MKQQICKEQVTLEGGQLSSGHDKSFLVNIKKWTDLHRQDIQKNLLVNIKD